MGANGETGELTAERAEIRACRTRLLAGGIDVIREIRICFLELTDILYPILYVNYVCLVVWFPACNSDLKKAQNISFKLLNDKLFDKNKF